MSNSNPLDYSQYVANIARSGLSIYDSIKIGDPDLWIPTPMLEALLRDKMIGFSVKDMALKTRSKIFKQAVSSALGYPVPNAFQRTYPKFLGQDFDTYIQKSNNLQIWNEEIAPDRRYAIFRVSDRDLVDRVRVITGEELALLDTTGTLTQKYQARLNLGSRSAELVAPKDTSNLRSVIGARSTPVAVGVRPIDLPSAATLLPIQAIFERITPLVGRSFIDAGRDQERNRGSELHRLICESLGYSQYQDNGQFPDILNQLLEVKLQTSPTIDLGLVSPNSESPLGTLRVTGRQVRHCDVRYAIFYGHTDGRTVTLTHAYLTTGEAFFTRFPQFQGKVTNKKLQIPLPGNFFD